MFVVIQANYDSNTGPEVFGPFNRRGDATAWIKKATDKFAKGDKEWGPRKCQFTFYPLGASELYTAESWVIQKLKK